MVILTFVEAVKINSGEDRLNRDPAALPLRAMGTTL